MECWKGRWRPRCHASPHCSGTRAPSALPGDARSAAVFPSGRVCPSSPCPRAGEGRGGMLGRLFQPLWLARPGEATGPFHWPGRASLPLLEGTRKELLTLAYRPDTARSSTLKLHRQVRTLSSTPGSTFFTSHHSHTEPALLLHACLGSPGAGSANTQGLENPWFPPS